MRCYRFLKKNILLYLISFFPLLILETLSLAWDYYEENTSINLTITLIFMLISLLIVATKLFFDFFVFSITNRVSGKHLGMDYILHILLSYLFVQWTLTLAGYLIGFFVFPDVVWLEILVDTISISAYYVFVAHKLYNVSGKRSFLRVIVCLLSFYWLYIWYTITFNI